jgi:hypothetical protein
MFKNKIKATLRKLKSQSGQGMTEYILLLVIIIAVAAIFREPIKKAIGQKMDSVSGQIQGFSGE